MKIMYFAWLKEKIGMSEEEIILPSTVTTVNDLFTWMRTRGPGFAAALAEGNAVKVAINHAYAHLNDPVGDTDEVAFFPPVTGG